LAYCELHDNRPKGRFGSNPAVFITQRRETGRPIKFKCRKWSIIVQFAALLQRVRGFGPVIRTESRGVELNLTTCVPRLSVEAAAVARRACEQLHAAGIEMFRQQNYHGRRTVGVVVVVERDLPRER
jgi:hypothetical protein